MAESEFESSCREVKFSSDDYEIIGILHLPKVEHPPVIIGCHGMNSAGDSPKQIALAEKCFEQGIAYFRFDHRGCGRSGGEFTEVTSLEGRSRDLKDAVKTLNAMNELGNVVGFFGSSFGGTVCLNVAKSVHVEAIVVYASPIRSSSLFDNMDKHNLHDANAPVVDRKKMQFDISGVLSAMHNILILHGDSDKVVPPSHAWEIYRRATTPKRLIMLKNGDHRMSLPENQEKFIRETILWFKATIDRKKVI